MTAAGALAQTEAGRSRGGTGRNRLRDAALKWVICTCLAVQVCWISGELTERYERHREAVAQQLALFRGDQYYEDGIKKTSEQFQPRLLFPAILTAACHWKIFTPSQWFYLLRLGTAVAAYVAFWSLLKNLTPSDNRMAALGTGFLNWGMIFMLNHRWEHPTDFPDVFFLSLALWALLRRRRVLLFLITILGCTNHQTMAFTGVLWFCLYAFDAKWRLKVVDILYSGFLMASGVATCWFVRFLVYGLGPGGPFTTLAKRNGAETLNQIKRFLKNPTPSDWPVLLVALVTPCAWWLWINRKRYTFEERRLLLAMGLILAQSMYLVYMKELRSIFLMPLVITTFVSTGAEARSRAASRAALPRTGSVEGGAPSPELS